MQEQDPPFQSMIRASGLAEVWDHNTDQLKFGQFGWRCTNKENSYSNDTLIGNWNEKRFDVERQKQDKRLPSQFEHYFETTNDVSYNCKPQTVPEELKHLKARHPHSFPGHQPELDSSSLKHVYNSFETTTRAAYVDPRIRKAPVQQGPSYSPGASNAQ